MSEATYGWIKLRGILIEAVSIGAYAHEKAAPQPVVIDADLWVATGRAAAADQLEAAVDYTEITARIKRCALAKHFNLLETLCETVAAAVLEHPGVSRVHLDIAKPFALSNGRVSVSVERSR